MIIGRDLLTELGIDLMFSSGEMKWAQAWHAPVCHVSVRPGPSSQLDSRD
jgi:hypothetical protein